MMILNKRTALEILGLLLITLTLYWPSFQFDFVNYDDQVYVLNNPFIQNPSLTFLLDGSNTGNFHPITMLSLLLDHWLGSGSASIFHFSNLVWHVLNTLLVYVFTGRLFSGKNGFAFFISLLFAIHPMHIESVAWISSRKDLVYTFFYLISLITYYDYLKTDQKKHLIFAIIAAVFSLLSKPAAITIPVALMLLQYWKYATFTLQRILPLLPLFFGSLIIGVLTIQLQSNDAINDLETYSIIERVGFAFYGLYFYITQSLIPLNLTPMHPYPKTIEMMSWAFLLPIFIGFVLVTLGLFIARKNRSFGFAFLFFLLNLLLMLQFVSIGRAIVAERYSYLSYLGLFIAFGLLLDKFPSTDKFQHKFYLLGLVLGIPLFTISKDQVRVWQNSETLWSKTITENPTDWYGFIGRGNYYSEIGKNKKALADFLMSIEIDPNQFENYFNLGDLQHKMGRNIEAISTYSSAIQLNPNYEKAYINRGQFYMSMNDGVNALADFNTAISIHPKSFLAFNNRGNLYLLTNKKVLAISDFSEAININPDYAKAWFNRGTAQIESNPKKAIQDLEQAVFINPNYFDAYNNLGSVYYQLQNFEFAVSSFSRATQIQPRSSSTWLNLSVAKNSYGDYLGALDCALQARENGANVSESYIEELRLKMN